MHAMAHVRGHPDDFALWAEAGGPRWSYEALLPAFRRSERFSGGSSKAHGADGPLPVFLPADELHPLVRDFMRAGRSIGGPQLDDHNIGHLAGVAPNSLTIRDGRRVTVADAYLTPEARDRLTLIITGCTVERLTIAGGRVVGIEARRDGVAETLRAGTIVLSAGTIGSPLLLMRSGIGEPAMLQAAGIPCHVPLPGVGRNLHDHLLAGIVIASRQPVPPSRLQHSESLMYLHSDDPSRAAGAPDCVVACVVAPVVSEWAEQPDVGAAYTLMCGVTHPTSRGDIRIAGPDSDAPPIIDPAYLSTEHDRRTFRASFALARAVGNAAPLDSWRATELIPGPTAQTDDAIDAFIAGAAITHHHPCGTCRMGHDEGSVVDGDLRVRGIDNLFIVDASIMPSITSGPINASVVAIAEQWASQVGARKGA